ncbi:DUF3550 and rve domain containing protein [Trichuris trichiura]|uniref:RNA-directed DNA polymerase n=1 Tax=Trichuris trichiura TaxID=36087 RepID=A0A077ZNE8_TRITR|nr:DUF3550 and rve domain containing protein [Trichuris trichiura]
MFVQISKELPVVKYYDIVKATGQCMLLQKVINCVQNGWSKNAKDIEERLIPFFRIKYELAAQNAHESHQGIARTKSRLRDLYWWPKLDAYIESYIKNCSTCRQMDKIVMLFHAPLQPLPFPSSAWDKLGVDVVVPLQGMPYGHRFAEIFSREGYPNEIVTDNGKQFTSYEFKRFLEEHAIRHNETSLYYPQANGEIERFNRTLKDALQAAQIRLYSKLLTMKQLLMNYRATPHCVTRATPSLLLHGRTLRTKLHATVTPKSVDDHAIRARVCGKQDYVSRNSDGRRKPRPPNLVQGDMYTRRCIEGFPTMDSVADNLYVTEQEKEIVDEFCYLLNKSRQLFNGLRDLQVCSGNTWMPHFFRTFEVFTKLWKFQQQNRWLQPADDVEDAVERIGGSQPPPPQEFGYVQRERAPLRSTTALVARFQLRPQRFNGLRMGAGVWVHEILRVIHSRVMVSLTAQTPVCTPFVRHH